MTPEWRPRLAVTLVVFLLFRVTAPIAAAEPTAGWAWTLTAEQLSATGLRYHGVTTTQVGDTPVKVLRFTASELWIVQATLVADLGSGRELTMTAASGHASAAPGSPIEILTPRLAGTIGILGIGLPVDLTPSTPPPLVLPVMTMTGVTAAEIHLTSARLTLTGTRLTAR